MTHDRGPTLLAIARGAIAEPLGEAAPPFELANWLQEPGSSFVTLMLHGELRGCIGSLSAQRPLAEDVAFNARAAAFQDTRFEPLSLNEFFKTDIEVSLLSAPEPIAFESQTHLLSLLRPGVDGVILEYGWWRGTFLPQVWEQLPGPQAFLAHLKQKAGLPHDFWADEIRFSRYTVTKWRESEVLEKRR